MRKWVVRLGALLVFNIVILLVIGFLTPARVGFAALWAAIVMTLLEAFVKPLIAKWFASMTAKTANQRTRAGQAIVRFFSVLLLAFIVWVMTVLLSGVSVSGWLWGYVLPPIIITIGWFVYAKLVVDRLEAKAGELYDRARPGEKPAAAATSSPHTEAAKKELHDGLTPEQRRMLDELG